MQTDKIQPEMPTDRLETRQWKTRSTDNKADREAVEKRSGQGRSFVSKLKRNHRSGGKRSVYQAANGTQH